MAGGGRFKIKGGIASKGEAVVVDGALLVTGISGGSGGRFQTNYYGERTTVVTSVLLMQEADTRVAIARAVSTGNVAVRYERAAGAPPGDWTLRLFKNGLEVATFVVATT